MKNAVQVARTCLGISKYDFFKENADPPHIVNCYILVHWVYEECGIRIPETLVGQLYAGTPIASTGMWQDGDLIFRGDAHWGAYHDEDRARGGVGHVGILTCSRTVLHASWKHRTVVEESIEKFLGRGLGNQRFRGVYRVV